MIAVLLVDDESPLLEMIRAILEQDEEIKVDCVLSGAEALRIMEEGQYDVIVADYEMSGMDGIELLKKIKARGCETPFIIFTGKGREHGVIQALNCDADFYLQKGGDPEVQFVELGNMIRKAALRKRTHESERRYRAVVEDLTESICRFRPDGTHVFVNEAYCRYFGKTRDEIIGRRFGEEVRQRTMSCSGHTLPHSRRSLLSQASTIVS